MKDTPSYNGIGSRSKTVLRTTRKETENSVTTQRPAPSTPLSKRTCIISLCSIIKTLSFILTIFLL